VNTLQTGHEHQSAKSSGSGASKRRLLWITDVPTPYRIHQLDALGRELASRDIALQVFFMARSVPWRHWSIPDDQIPFDHWDRPGLHPRIGNTIFHVNPGIALSVARLHPPG
jgi:hypothetical protein